MRVNTSAWFKLKIFATIYKVKRCHSKLLIKGTHLLFLGKPLDSITSTLFHPKAISLYWFASQLPLPATAPNMSFLDVFEWTAQSEPHTGRWPQYHPNFYPFTVKISNVMRIHIVYIIICIFYLYVMFIYFLSSPCLLSLKFLILFAIYMLNQCACVPMINMAAFFICSTIYFNTYYIGHMWGEA